MESLNFFIVKIVLINKYLEWLINYICKYPSRDDLPNFKKLAGFLTIRSRVGVTFLFSVNLMAFLL